MNPSTLNYGQHYSQKVDKTESLTVVVFIGEFLTFTKKPAIVGVYLMIFLCLVDMLWLMSYTILYYHCKKNHGEEVELPWKKGYSEVPTLAFLDKNQPHDQGEFCNV